MYWSDNLNDFSDSTTSKKQENDNICSITSLITKFIAGGRCLHMYIMIWLHYIEYIVLELHKNEQNQSIHWYYDIYDQNCSIYHK